MGTQEIVINVSQLTCAVLDDSWLERWLAGTPPSTQKPAPKGVGVVYGQEFHQIAEGFARWLVGCASDHPVQTCVDGSELFDFCYDQVAWEQLRQVLNDPPKALDGVLHLRDCLHHFCQRLAQLRREAPPEWSWRNLFAGVELTLQPARFDYAGRVVRVTGRLDLVRRHPTRAMEVVDYKLSRGNNPKHDLVQLAIYAALMRHHDPGVQPMGVLEYYLPHVHIQEATSEELHALFQELVEPVLRRLAGAGTSPVAPIPAPGREEDLSGRIRQVLASFKLGVTVTERVVAPQLIRYRLRPDEGVRAVSLASRAKDLQVHLNLSVPPLVSSAPGCVILDLPRDAPLTMGWEAWRQAPPWQQAGPLSIPLGVGVENDLLTADLGDTNQCHLLVAGGTGSGKSVFLQSMVATLMSRNTPATLRLAVVDPKRLTFTALEGSPYLLQPVIEEVDEALEMLQKMVDEMERRFRLLKKARMDSLHDWQRLGAVDLPYYVVVVVDEFADLVMVDKESKKQFEKLVGRLAGKARAAGIHLVLATQRPDRTIVTGVIKANLPLKVCLKVANAVNSTIILDVSGGEDLLGKGDLLCNLGLEIRRAQSLWITPRSLAQAARAPEIR